MVISNPSLVSGFAFVKVMPFGLKKTTMHRHVSAGSPIFGIMSLLGDIDLVTKLNPEHFIRLGAPPRESDANALIISL